MGLSPAADRRRPRRRAGAAAARRRPYRWIATLPVAACLAYQTWRIFPYTPLAPKEMRLAPAEPGTITLLASNVLMENTEHARVARLIEAVDPDVLLLMETDRAWIEALEPVLARYRHRGARAARQLLRHGVRDPARGDRGAHRLPDHGRHAHALRRAPRPARRAVPLRRPAPAPAGPRHRHRGARRGDPLRRAVRAGPGMPLVAMGDFNDAAWSDTAQKFKALGGYVDPRRGRGSTRASTPTGRCCAARSTRST